MSQIPAGWYDDGSGRQRYWDGNEWTDYFADTYGEGGAGAADQPAAVDPLEAPTQIGRPDAEPAASSDPDPSGAGDVGASPDATVVANRGGPTGQPDQPDSGGWGAPSEPAPGYSGQQAQPGWGAPDQPGQYGQQPGQYGAPASQNPYGQPGGGYGQDPGYGAPGYGPPGQPPAGPPPGQGWGQPGGMPPGGGYGAPGYGPPGGGASGGGGGGKGKLILIVGGAVLAVIIVVVLAITFIGGGGGPESAAEDFFGAAKDQDCDQVEFLSNKSLDATADNRDDKIDDFKSECEDAKDSGDYDEDLSGCEIDITSTDEDGDSADVDYEVSGCEDDDNNETGTLTMVQEDGDWRVDATS